VQRLGYRDATDRVIFEAARAAQAIVINKDSDFVGFLELHGPPPQVLWITLGNTSNTNLKDVLSKVFERALKLFAAGEPLVEIGEVS
jgi:predicted nuclease of predicted toxin-antitoxin system